MSTTVAQRIHDETAKDVILQHLTCTIVDGWPEVHKDCPANLLQHLHDRHMDIE